MSALILLIIGSGRALPHQRQQGRQQCHCGEEDDGAHDGENDRQLMQRLELAAEQSKAGRRYAGKPDE